MKTLIGFMVPTCAALAVGAPTASFAGVDDFNGTQTQAPISICAKAATPGALGESMLLQAMCLERLEVSGGVLRGATSSAATPTLAPTPMVSASDVAPATVAPTATPETAPSLAGVMSGIRQSKRDTTQSPSDPMAVASSQPQSTTNLIRKIKAQRRLTLGDNLWLIGGFR